MASHQINIRLSSEEHARVTAMAAASGLPLATWVKAKLLTALEGDEIRSLLEMMMVRQTRFDEHLLERVNAIFQATLENLPLDFPERSTDENSKLREKVKSLVGKSREAALKFSQEVLNGE